MNRYNGSQPCIDLIYTDQPYIFTEHWIVTITRFPFQA